MLKRYVIIEVEGSRDMDNKDLNELIVRDLCGAEVSIFVSGTVKAVPERNRTLAEMLFAEGEHAETFS